MTDGIDPGDDAAVQGGPLLRSLRGFRAAIVVGAVVFVSGLKVGPVSSDPAVLGNAPPASATFPLIAPSVDTVTLQLAPDGTLYVSALVSGGGQWIVALDSKGGPKPGWPVSIAPASPPVIAPDGTLLVVGCDLNGAGPCQMDALTPAGRQRAGWPVALPAAVACDQPLPGPRNDAFVVCRRSVATTRAYRVALGGQLQADWPVDVAGLSRSQRLVGDTLYSIQAQAAGLRDVSVGPDGQVRRGPAVAEVGNDLAARGYAIAPDGTALTWGATVKNRTPSGDSTFISAKLLGFGLTGVLWGWPYVSSEPISAPAFGPDSTIYFTRGRATSNGRVVTLDRHAHPRPGWPVTLPVPAVTGHEGEGGPAWADIPAPIVAADGRVYLASIANGTTLVSLAPNGASRSGWPYRSTRPLASACPDVLGITGCGSPVLSPVVAPNGIVYVPLAGSGLSGGGSRIVTLNPDGRIRPGWPFGLSSSSQVTSLLPGAGGKLYVAEVTGGSAPSASVTALDSGGHRLYQTTVAVMGPSASAVTLADDQSTITMHVGDRFLLDLGLGLDWTVTVGNPSIVSRVVNIAVPVGAQGVYEAHAPGQTTLSAVGDPPCRQAVPPCAAPSRLFQVTIVVK